MQENAEEGTEVRFASGSYKVFSLTRRTSLGEIALGARQVCLWSVKTQWALFRDNCTDTEGYSSKVPVIHGMINPPLLRQPPYHGSEARFARLEEAYHLYSLLNYAFLKHGILSSNTMVFYTPDRTAHTAWYNTSIELGGLRGTVTNSFLGVRYAHIHCYRY